MVHDLKNLDSVMSEILKQTIRISRPSKTKVDERGRSVWTEKVETVELELVSTMMLQTILDSNDEEARQQIENVANHGDGVLARDQENNRFEIVDADGHEEFSLVSTQMLKRILIDPNDNEPDCEEAASGFDPYNSR